jgi:oligopeptidase B
VENKNVNAEQHKDPLPQPPDAPRRPYELSAHGHTRVDDYYWLRHRDDSDVIAYLEAENAYTEHLLAHTEPLQQQLYEEMVSRIKESDQSVPEPLDDYLYYTRTEKGKEYRICCRRANIPDADEEILLDLNELAEGHDFLKLGIFKVSPDHNLLAYSIDTSGAEEFTIYFKDLRTGERLADQIAETDYSAEWSADSQSLFYTTFDRAKRSDKVWRHRLESDPNDDSLLFHEQDELYRVFLYSTKDRRYIVLLIRSMETGEVHTIPADDPDQPFTLIEPRTRGVRYHIEHNDGRFFILTNWRAPNFRLMVAPATAPGRENWQEYLGHRQDVLLEGIELFSRYLVLYERQGGLRTIRVDDLQESKSHHVPFAEAVYTYSENNNPEFTTDILRFTYQSLTTPDTVYDYNMATGEKLLKKQEVVRGYDSDLYRSERLYATSHDGVVVPVSVVYRKDLVTAGAPAPCLLYGYGSYGYSMDPGFNSNRISLLDRGFMWAIAHIRGGEEMGRAWYDQGKFLNKRNTFEDFVACARHLIASGYTAPDRLAIMGRSAGGLLIGAVLNMAPQLFRAAIAGVPFVDVVTTMLDESIPLTVGEFEEWGNPQERDYFDYMLSYSPYDNVADRNYPELLVTAGLNDPRVQYWEPAKWVARLRDHWSTDRRLLLKTEMGAGHAGPSGRYEALREVALYYAFLLDAIRNREAIDEEGVSRA